MLAVFATTTTMTTTTEAHAQEIVQLGQLGAMDEDTEAFIKEYLISTIRNNLTDFAVSISSEDGQMLINTFSHTPNIIGDDLFFDIGNTEFTEANGYSFERGKIVAPNGTQILPR